MGYTHYIKSVDSPSSLEDALKVREQISKVLHRNKKFLQYEYDLPYTPENSIIFDKEGNPQNIIRFNGIGDEGHETFYINSGLKDGFNFCKTSRKDYDVAVCECLLILKCFLNATVTSDGFSNFQGAGKPYKIGDTVKSKDIDGTWALAVRRVNKQLGTNYKFVVRSVYGGDGQYFSYVLSNK